MLFFWQIDFGIENSTYKGFTEGLMGMTVYLRAKGSSTESKEKLGFFEGITVNPKEAYP